MSGTLLTSTPRQSGLLPDVQRGTIPDRDRRQRNTTENVDGNPVKLPRIVLKDKLGNKLDTFTHLQDAIYRAELNVRTTREANLPEEWRLPKAPLPSRPDYSRNVPIPAHSFKRKMNKEIWEKLELSLPKTEPHVPFIEIDVDDVAFVAESLNHLPHAPSMSFLRHEFLTEPKLYFHIVQSILLQNRYFTATDKRQAIYNFPGLCYGCKKLNVCHGCERSNEPHYHMDQLYRNDPKYQYFLQNPRHGQMAQPQICPQPIKKWRLQKLSDADRAAYNKRLNQFQTVEAMDNVNDDLRGVKSDHINRRISQLSHPNTSRSNQDSTTDSVSGGDKKSYRYQSSKSQSTNQSVSLRFSSKGHDQDGSSTEGENVQNNRASGDNSKEGNGEGDEGYSGWTRPGYNSEEDFYYERHERVHSNKGGHRSRFDRNLLEKEQSTSLSDGDKLRRRHLYRPTLKDKNKVWGAKGDNSRRRSQSDNSAALKKDSQTETDDENARSKSESPLRDSKKAKLYRAPPAFKPKPRVKKKIEARSPFSTNRNLDVPKGPGFQVKKSDKPTTEFKEFKQRDVEWKEPKKFEVTHSNKKATKFWKPPNNKNSNSDKGKKGKKLKISLPEEKPVSPDSGLESEKLNESGQDNLLDKEEETEEMAPIPTVGKKPEIVNTPSSQKIGTSDKPKKEKPKKTKVRKEVESKPVEPSKLSPIPTPIPEPPAEDEQETFVSQEKGEYVPAFEIPPLPEIKDEPKKEPKVKDDKRSFIQPMPKLKDVVQDTSLPKKKQSAKQPKSRHLKKTKSTAEAPVTGDEVKSMQDPLDFLAKYCIIHKDRLPFYERIYNNMVSQQAPRYQRAPRLSPRSGMPLENEASTWGEHEMKMFHDLVVISRGQDKSRVGLSPAEQYLEKTCFTIEILDEKQKQITKNMQKLEATRNQKLAVVAKTLVPGIEKPDYQPKAKKGKKKKKKSARDDQLPVIPLSKADITDEVIVSRIDEKMLKTMSKEPEIAQLDLEIERCIEKLSVTEDRLLELENEKNIIGVYCMECFFASQKENERADEFRRVQSALYRTLHPLEDIEMNIEHLEGALQSINGNLLSQKEFEYLFHILNLPGRRKINFQLFSVVAALSEKVTQMDPAIRKLINKVDYNALDTKMSRCKELFALLCDEETCSNAPASTLAVELTAGGLSPEHTDYVLSKFNREGHGYVDFLDFVTYVPLFIEIHERIIRDPLNGIFH